jgi:hypothetical protein
MGKLLFINVKDFEKDVFNRMTLLGYKLDLENPVKELDIQGDKWNVILNPAPHKINIDFTFS